MTKGNIWRQLIAFAIPLLLGSLLQQLYNAVDAVVVGNYVGPEALATVGVTTPLVTMMVAAFQGLASGASVLISQYFGAKDEKNVQDTVHTSMMVALVLGIILSAIGYFASPYLLRLMKTPDVMMESANSYLTIYFAGLTGLTIYNMGAAIMTSVGDSRRPLYFLLFSTIFNTFADLLFVAVFKWGVAGAAYATILAQAISAVMVVFVLTRSEGLNKLYLRKVRIDVPIVGRIARIGLPSAIQQAIVSMSNVVVLSYINTLGMTVVAGYSAANKLDAFLPLPLNTMALAVTTFVAQNLGAGNVDRARQGTKCSLIIGTSVTMVLSVIVLVFHTSFLRIFTKDDAVLQYGWEFMRTFAPFYFILAGTQIIPGALRGSGDTLVSTIACVGSFVVLRQIYLAIITQYVYTPTVIALSFPGTWLVAAAIVTIHYLRSDWSRFEKHKAPEAGEMA